ncbi:pantoate--beta-alanine ligase [Skermanella stibiiresistens SB22]|uniref:Pantothenate synthetase n=1 Tax=Skermanella stibiiresistens SB22 TaxID=1385369 RepID=W9H9K0_9PROT|nr:pantoate--beta-alanine ligase [Skermanella stibiiresistens]EWY41431.1 pantoate--beta-alanine ligase [Skermanella stibiiresistens SB22]
MTENLTTIRTVADLRARVATWRAAGEKVGLVPTMGALHEGHLSLVQAARRRGADHVVVSVFVNPTQFGPNEDFSKYPRQEASDAAKLASVGADLLYAPDVGEMYPDGFSTTVHVAGLTEGLCGPLRPGHFDGVATVVSKLLLQCLPDVAVFGQKDYQQLQVIRRMVRDLDIPVMIEGAETVRDEAGLALSSRNAYLTPDQLTIARQLNTVLFDVAADVAAEPTRCRSAIEWGLERLRAAGFDRIDYLAICDAASLEPLEIADRPARVLAAAFLGRTRLIDNIAV